MQHKGCSGSHETGVEDASLISFEGSTPAASRPAFIAAVDRHIDRCAVGRARRRGMTLRALSTRALEA